MEYERFADIYDVWTSTAPSARANYGFYLDLYRRASGMAVELGVGDGRIAVDAAATAQQMIGVDLSPAMLARCRSRAEAAGVSDRLTLIEADFRSFRLPGLAELITLPYHSIGHLPSLETKRDAIGHIYSQLRPGGRFVFDDFFMTPERLAYLQQVQLRAEYHTNDGRHVLLWVTSIVDAARQAMRVVTWEDTLDSDGRMADRRYRMLSLTWLRPDESKVLLEDAGFRVEACYGDFAGTPFDEAHALEQVWVARKDAA